MKNIIYKLQNEKQIKNLNASSQGRHNRDFFSVNILF